MTEKAGNVLIIDDEEEIREIIAFICRRLGFETYEAADGQAAIQQIETLNHHLNIILSDLVMPEMNGIELLQHCSKISLPIPFIFITGNGSNQTLHKALRLGAFDYIEKPFAPDVITQLLHSAVIESKRMRERSGPVFAFEIASKNHHGFPAVDYSEEARNAFIEETYDLLTFGTSTMQSLNAQSAPVAELSFLFRIARSIAFRSNQIGLYDIHDLATHITECLIYFRTNPSALIAPHVKLLSEGFQRLRQAIEAVESQRGPVAESLQIRGKMNALKLGLFGS